MGCLVTDTEVAGAEEAPVLQFPTGILGFPGMRRFVLRQLVDDSAFQLLESVEGDGVSMVVTRPWLFFPDYVLDIDDTDQHELGLHAPDDAIVFCPVSIDSDEGRLYLNLRGPFIVNAKTNEGRQIVLDEDQPLRAVVDLGLA